MVSFLPLPLLFDIFPPAKNCPKTTHVELLLQTQAPRYIVNKKKEEEKLE